MSAGPAQGVPVTATQPAPVPTHRMLPGSHERMGGPECRCGASWDRINDECADTQPALTVPDEAVEAAWSAWNAAESWEQMPAALAAAAPFIVAANQPDAVDAVEATLVRVLDDFTTSEGIVTTNVLPALVLVVEAMVVAAVADERAKAGAGPRG